MGRETFPGGEARGCPALSRPTRPSSGGGGRTVLTEVELLDSDRCTVRSEAV